MSATLHRRTGNQSRLLPFQGDNDYHIFDKKKKSKPKTTTTKKKKEKKKKKKRKPVCVFCLFDFSHANVNHTLTATLRSVQDLKARHKDRQAPIGTSVVELKALNGGLPIRVI